ncbi:hypothetical protein [Chondrinema litorale]|uniref:hypothetical protein n=1 Tax=Chondrinema litorale TaxID=2994555 RepID=UPI002542A1C2|nr:hypothetical protein [Chondrinema litorale]UZR94315.1 hypothetical protein OQ292_00600 [Chondrinema litorale]
MKAISKTALSFVLVFMLIPIVKSTAQSNLEIDPKEPKPGDEVTVTYNPANTPLAESVVIKGRAIMYEKTAVRILTADILLKQTGGKWLGKFNLLRGSVAINIFFENNSNEIDSNKGEGYIYYLKDSNGTIFQGAKAAIASGVYGMLSDQKFPNDKTKTRKLLEEEFSKNPDLLQYYFATYYRTFNLYDKDESKFITEIADKLYAVRDTLDAKPIADLAFFYQKSEQSKSEKCIKILSKCHPSSISAFQLQSMDMQMELMTTSDFKTKLKAYKKESEYFKESLELGEKDFLNNLEFNIILKTSTLLHLNGFQIMAIIV